MENCRGGLHIRPRGVEDAAPYKPKGRTVGSADVRTAGFPQEPICLTHEGRVCPAPTVQSQLKQEQKPSIMSTTSKSKTMTEGPLAKQILLVSLPLALSNLLQILFNMSDVAVVGRFAGSTALGSVGSTATFVTLFTGFLIGLSNGVNVLVARFYGAGHPKDVSKTVHSALLVSLAAGVLLLETVLQHIDSIPYLQSRLDGWTQDLTKMTDQTLQSLYAIGSGGVTGLGLGNSIEKQLWLPESTNDFIFSVVCEELGFVGAVLVILLFVLFLVQGFWLAFHAENRFCTLVGIGIMAQIAWQVFCNIAVVTNTIPNTGISLPFFSSGGTSLILLLAEMGVMVNIGRNGERAAQQRAAAHAQRQAAKAQRDAELKDRTINLDDARRARDEL